MIKFGDILLHNGTYYIYLGEKNDNYTYYFGKVIQDAETIRELISKKNASTGRPDPKNPVRKNTLDIITSFVILTSDDFVDDAAFLGNPDLHNIPLANCVPIGSLNPDDCGKIKQYIIENSHVFPPPLVRFVKELSQDIPEKNT